MQKDKLTVGTITANYNDGQYFRDCLVGLRTQHRKPNIVMVIDDGSTDNSWELILKAFTELTPIEFGDEDVKKSNHEFELDGTTYKLLQLQKNMGPSFTRNVGLQYLSNKADVICIADADDIYYPGKISRSLEVLLKYPQVALVYSDYDVEDMRTGDIKREYKEIYSFKRLFQECIVSNNSVFATKILGLTGGYDDSIRGGEDYDLWLRMAEHAGIYHIPEALYRYRLTGKNSTLTIPRDKFAEYVQKVHAKAYERRQKMVKA